MSAEKGGVNVDRGNCLGEDVGGICTGGKCPAPSPTLTHTIIVIAVSFERSFLSPDVDVCV